MTDPSTNAPPWWADPRYPRRVAPVVLRRTGRTCDYDVELIVPNAFTGSPTRGPTLATVRVDRNRDRRAARRLAGRIAQDPSLLDRIRTGNRAGVWDGRGEARPPKPSHEPVPREEREAGEAAARTAGRLVTEGRWCAGDADGGGYFVVGRRGGKPPACVPFDPPGRGRGRSEAWRLAYAIAAGTRRPGVFGKLPDFVREPRPLPTFTLDVDGPHARLRHPDGRDVTKAELDGLASAP